MSFLLILTSVGVGVLLGLVRCLTICKTRVDHETLTCAKGFLGHSKVRLSGVTWPLLIFRVLVLPGCVEIEVLAPVIADSRDHRVGLPGPSVCLSGYHSRCLPNGNVLRVVSIDSSSLAGWSLSKTKLLRLVITATLGESALSVDVCHVLQCSAVQFKSVLVECIILCFFSGQIWLDHFKSPFD